MQKKKLQQEWQKAVRTWKFLTIEIVLCTLVFLCLEFLPIVAPVRFWWTAFAGVLIVIVGEILYWKTKGREKMRR